MTVGLLEQKIRDLPKFLNDSMTLDVPIDKILEVVAEAKRDWPKPEDMMPKGHYRTNWVYEINAEKTKWFKKWFGEEAEGGRQQK